MKDEKFIEAVEKLIKANTPLMVTEGVVSSVDKENRTCNVSRTNLPDLIKVRLTTVLEAGDNVIIIYPKLNSKVLCAIIENNPADAFMLSAAEIDEIIINGGSFGGLVKIGELEEKLNNLKDKVDEIKESYVGHTHYYITAAGTPAPVSWNNTGVPVVPDPSAPNIDDADNFDRTDFEDEKIKH